MVNDLNLKCGISRKRCEIEFVSIEDHYKVSYGFRKKLKYLTFGDPKRSRSLTEMLDAEYLAQYEIEISYQHNAIIKSHIGFR